MKGLKVAVVGGSAGIGLAIAKQARALGAEVIIGGRNPERLAAAAGSLGVRGIIVDTMNEESVKHFFSETGPVDHLATPGSSIRIQSLRQTSLEDLQFSVHNKFLGQALCAKHAQIQHMGSITLFSGMLAERPAALPLLGAINAAVEALGRGLAVELAPVRVNVLSPGLTRHTIAFAGMTEEAQTKMFAAAAAALPVGRVGEPEDMAGAALFLMQSPFITGQVLIADGGAVAMA